MLNQIFKNKMYKSLILPWSDSPSEMENAYRSAGLVRTQGSIFLLPPTRDHLTATFNAPPKPKSRMSSGAVALCKHFERGGASSERGRPHPFWPLPQGSNDNKTLLAAQTLEKMLDDAQWRNVMMLHPGVAVYEIRNSLGFGMRWTLMLVRKNGLPETLEDDTTATDGSYTDADRVSKDEEQLGSVNENNEITWKISTVSFRGLLEPIIGLDHELPSNI